jgi:integrase
MRGHVHRRGKAWAFVVDVGRDPATGKRRQKTKGGFPTRVAAERALRQVLGRVDDGSYSPESNLTLGEYLEQWLATVKPNLRPTTHGGYSRSITHIVWKLGHVRLTELTPLQIETAYTELMEQGRYGRPLAAKSVRHVHTALRRALGDAERLGVIARNAARLARPPTYHPPEMLTWSAEDLGLFLEQSRGDRLHTAFVLLATTGMRRGEVMGLRWRDVNLDGGWLSVEQTLTTVEDRILIGPTKTPRSRRRIALDPATIATLRRHRAAQAEERLAAGELWVDDNDLVFRQQDGAPMHPDVLTRRFKRLAADAGLRRLRGPHNLRHTWATLALQAGIHPKVVSDRLGHATIAITIDTYSHVIPALGLDAANVVASRILGGAKAE